jgi:hypothetical protein
MRLSAGFVGGMVAALASAGLAFAAPVNVPNGGFEEGKSFAPWQTFSRGGGEWIRYGFIRGPLPFPPQTEGNVAAGLATEDPGVNILHRTLTLKKNKTNRIKFDLFYETAADLVAPRNFRWQDGKNNPNQQIRVDIMKPKARIKSLRKKDVLATVFRTRTGAPSSRKFAPVTGNLTQLGVERKRVRLRIAEVDNQAPFNVAVDHLRQTAG